MRVLVCGGRDYDDLAVIQRTLWLMHRQHRFSCLIHGGARGADTIAGQWAERVGVPVEVYPAEWDKYGRAAGSIRNGTMLESGKPDAVVAFPGGRGTADMVRRARAAGVRIFVGSGVGSKSEHAAHGNPPFPPVESLTD